MTLGKKHSEETKLKWSDFPELRFELSNCRTLCQRCHYFITYDKIMPSDKKTWGHNLKQIEVRC